MDNTQERGSEGEQCRETVTKQTFCLPTTTNQPVSYNTNLIPVPVTQKSRLNDLCLEELVTTVYVRCQEDAVWKQVWCGTTCDSGSDSASQ